MCDDQPKYDHNEAYRFFKKLMSEQVEMTDEECEEYNKMIEQEFEKENCIWTRVSAKGSNYHIYRTACGNEFIDYGDNISIGLSDFKFCPFCSLTLEVNNAR